MKIKVKKTGEVFDVSPYSKVEIEYCDSYGTPIDFCYDEVEFLQDITQDSDIDWEQRRYEIAKSVTASVCSIAGTASVSDEFAVKVGVHIADMLIEKLKEK